MNKIFNLDNIFFRFMDKVADFLIINTLTVLCSLPVFTIGAAITAAHRMMQNIVLGNEQPLFKAYFHSFVRSFKQATILWIMFLLTIAILFVDTLLVYLLMDGFFIVIIYGLILLATVLMFGVVSYAFPLLARYKNTVKSHIRNAILLSLGNLPRTVLILVVNAAPFLLVLMDVSIFIKTIFVWIFFGVSILTYLITKLICPVFSKIDQMCTNCNELTS